VQLHRELPRIRQLGASLVFVGNGPPHFARGFVADYHLTGDGVTVYSDPSLATYKALSFKRGVGGILDPRSLFKGAGRIASGFMQGRVQGDSLQLGGTLIVTPDGHVAFEHRSAYAGDYVPAAEVVAALEAAVTSTRTAH
jgi:hypothetical protein